MRTLVERTEKAFAAETASWVEAMDKPLDAKEGQHGTANQARTQSPGSSQAKDLGDHDKGEVMV